MIATAVRSVASGTLLPATAATKAASGRCTSGVPMHVAAAGESVTDGAAWPMTVGRAAAAAVVNMALRQTAAMTCTAQRMVASRHRDRRPGGWGVASPSTAATISTTFTQSGRAMG